MKTQELDLIKEIALEVVDRFGYELVDLEYKYGSKHDLLSIYVYRSENFDLDDCADMSREIDKKLDELDFLAKPYYLEISSPGIDRPIKTSDDLRRNKGKELDVKLYAPFEGKKAYSGILVDYDESSVLIKTKDEEIKIPLKNISKMVQSIRF